MLFNVYRPRVLVSVVFNNGNVGGGILLPPEKLSAVSSQEKSHMLIPPTPFSFVAVSVLYCLPSALESRNTTPEITAVPESEFCANDSDANSSSSSIAEKRRDDGKNSTAELLCRRRR